MAPRSRCASWPLKHITVPHSVHITFTTTCQLTLCSFAQGEPGPKHPEAAGRAVGAGVLAYWRNRASSPRDMTAEAAHQMRLACDEVLKETF